MTSPVKLNVTLRTVDDLRPHLADMDGDGDFRYGPGLTDVAHDNLRRAGFAANAVLAYVAQTFPGGCGEDFETVIGDLLGDLMHLCDAVGVSFDALVEQGHSHYQPELRGEL